MRYAIRGTAALACAATMVGGAHAQELVHTLVGGGAAGHGMGHSVRAAGDVDGDGRMDLIVGHRLGVLSLGANSGSATVWSGADGSLLHVLLGDAPGDELGRGVDGAGDVDGDGHADLIVGAAGHDGAGSDSGLVQVISGVDGSLLHSIPGPFAKARYGWAVAGVGDLDGDGLADFAASGQPDPFTPQPIGFVRVHSGATGDVIREIVGPTSSSRLGSALANAGDVDGDGLDDLVAGDWRDASFGNSSGAVWVHSGADGSLLLSFFGDGAGDRMGWSVDGAGDVNGDGRADLVAGTPFADGVAFDTGLVRVWSGADGALLHESVGEASLDFYGAAVGGAGDVDGDGLDDVLIGAFADDDGGTNAGRVTVHSGADFAVVYTIDGDSAADEAGFSVAGLGDVDGDGGLDFALGAPVDNAGGGNASGSVRVYRGVPPAGGLVAHYCSTSPNSVGPGALLDWSGSTSVSQNDATLQLSQAPPGGLALFFYGARATRTPLFHGVLCVAGPTQRLLPVRRIGRGGDALHALDLGRPGCVRDGLEIVPGGAWNFQVLYRDPRGQRLRRLNLSDALAVQFVH